jgi:two-component system cell cycle sensor histidine kinase/response regulator CckA
VLPDLRVIFISGYAEDVFRKGIGESSENFRFLPKPFTLKSLAEAVKESLS